MQTLLPTGQVSRMLGVRQHRIDYAISSGHLSDAKFRFLNKRCFDISDIRRIANHFGVPLPEGGQRCIGLSS
jgi:hypothetical protein